MLLHTKKNLVFFLFLLTLLLSLSGCSQWSAVESTSDENQTADSSKLFPLWTEANDLFSDYKKTGGEVALLTDISSIADHGFNQAAYEGIKAYAHAAGVSYSHYSASSNTPEEYIRLIETAASNKAKLIVCAGAHYAQAIAVCQTVYPDVDFLLLDSVPINQDGKKAEISENVYCIMFKEEQAGYLAGYMAVMEGYTHLGFIGGEQLPSVKRYGYGFLQGINAASGKLGNTSNIKVNYWYSGTFEADDRIAKLSSQWYQSGTEIIFSCGGSLYESVLSSAESNNKKLIGVDVNQSHLSDLFLTSAMKGVRRAVIIALDDYFAYGCTWPDEMGGEAISYGAEETCIELPTDNDSWRFQRVSLEDYLALFTSLKKGTITVSDSISSPPDVEITVSYFND